MICELIPVYAGVNVCAEKTFNILMAICGARLRAQPDIQYPSEMFATAILQLMRGTKRIVGIFPGSARGPGLMGGFLARWLG